MGILDTIQDGINKGVDGAGRATKKIQLNAQINEIDKQRDRLLAQLGASLFTETRDDPHFRSSREQVYAGIEALDARRVGVQNELAQIEQEGKALAAARATITCPTCGRVLSSDSTFCTGCGAAIAPAFEAAMKCAVCGAGLAADTRFCTSCGAPVIGEQPQPPDDGDYSATMLSWSPPASTDEPATPEASE